MFTIISVCPRVMSFFVCAPTNRPQVSVPPLHLKIVNTLKLKHYCQHHVPSTSSIDRLTQANILSKYFSVHLRVPSDVSGRVSPTLYIFRSSVFCLLDPLLSRFHPSFCTLSQALVPFVPHQRKSTCPFASHTAIRLCLQHLCYSLLLCDGISLR